VEADHARPVRARPGALAARRLRRLDPLVDAAARRYAGCGRYARHFARAKLRRDPVYLALLRRGLPERGTFLDLGCGQGLLLALLREASVHLSLQGIDSDPRRVSIARRALGKDAVIEERDLRELDFPQGCAAVALIDVLLYLPEPDAVLHAAAHALAPGGVLLVREPDADAGFAFAFTRLSSWFDAWARGTSRARRNYRSAAEWRAQLEGLGFSVETEPMSSGTPFANVLFICKK
jgi:trans-aconitate methyltransferase